MKPLGAKPTNTAGGISERPVERKLEERDAGQSESDDFEKPTAAASTLGKSSPRQGKSDPAMPASVQTSGIDPFADLADLASPTASLLTSTLAAARSTSEVAAELDDFFAATDGNSGINVEVDTPAVPASPQSQVSPVATEVTQSDNGFTAQSLTDFFSGSAGADATGAKSDTEAPSLSPTPDLRTALIDYYYVYNKEKLVRYWLFILCIVRISPHALALRLSGSFAWRQANVDIIVQRFGAHPAKLAKMFAQLKKLYGEVPAYSGIR